jgi:hypothetical protein
MLVVQVEATVEVVEVLAHAACMFQLLEAAVEVLVEAQGPVVEVGVDSEEQCTMEEEGDLVEAEEEAVLAPIVALVRPNFVPSLVLQE